MDGIAAVIFVHQHQPWSAHLEIKNNHEKVVLL